MARPITLLKIKRADWKEAFEVALATIRAQKLRAFLTMLGVVIGVGSVIVVAATIDGLNQFVSNKINELGSQTFFITRFQAFTFDFERLPEEIRLRKHFTEEDAQAIRELCPSVETAIALLTRAAFLGGTVSGSNEVRYGNNLVEEPLLRGAVPGLLDVLPMHRIREGRFITDYDNEHAASVIVLGAPIADTLFGPEDPIGKIVRLNGRTFEVIGVCEPHQGLFGGPGVDQFVFIPFKTFHKMYPEIKEIVLVMKARSNELFGRAQDEVTEVMRRRRRVPAHKPNDFEMTTADVITDLWNQLTGAIVLLTLIIASIGLLVGGIGVMNVMLVNVTERTAEIGVRKAVGARGGDIRSQFLLEAVTLTGVGGAAGVVAGVAVSLVIAAVVPNLPARVSLFWTFMGLLISLAVGLFFGIYPAVKAASLDPVRCLRYE